MAILGTLFAALGRFAGKLLNLTLGWATVLLFGKVEGRKQSLLLLVALGSLLWVVLVVGVLVPDVGTFLLAFVPVPSFVDEGLVRLTMLVAAAVLPLVVGATVLFLVDPADRPSGSGLVVGLLRGYPFTFVLALTLVVLAGAAIIRNVRSLIQRRESAHVPVIVKPGAYDGVLDDLGDVLREAGFDVRAEPAPRVLSVPPKLLDRVAGRGLGELVPDRMMFLRAPEVEVLVYPSDINISGSKQAVAAARAAIAAKLTEADAYLTASKEAEDIEDALTELARSSNRSFDVAALRARLEDIDQRLSKLTVPFDEWETLYRKRLQVERDALATAIDERATEAEPAERPSALPSAVGWMGLALAVLNVALAIVERGARPRSSG